MLKCPPAKLSERVEKVLEENKLLALQLKASKKVQLDALMANVLSRVENIHDVSLIAAKIEAAPDELRGCAEDLMGKLRSGVVVLGAVTADKCHIFIRVSDDLVKKGLKANEIVQLIAPVIEGSGGGKPNSAQAGGKALDKLEEAFALVRVQIQKGALC